MTTLQDLSCICCGNAAFRHLRTINGYDLFRCVRCRFVRVYPLPALTAVEAHYDETRTGDRKRELRRKSLAGFMTSSNNPKRDFFRDVLSRVSGMLAKPSLDILEIGSGFGHFVHYANLSGHRATGTEVTRAYAEMSSESLAGRIVHVEGGRYADYFSPASFDLIYMEHVFEHVLDPEPRLSQLRQLLRPGGSVFLAVPNMDSFSSRLQGRYWGWAVPPDHLYFYNRSNLSLLLRKHGFAVEEGFARDYFHRSIPQLFSLQRLTNLARRLCGMEPRPVKYAYPDTLGDYLLLSPYYLLYPIISRSWSRSGGSELIVFARRCD